MSKKVTLSNKSIVKNEIYETFPFEKPISSQY